MVQLHGSFMPSVSLLVMSLLPGTKQDGSKNGSQMHYSFALVGRYCQKVLSAIRMVDFKATPKRSLQHAITAHHSY